MKDIEAAIERLFGELRSYFRALSADDTEAHYPSRPEPAEVPVVAAPPLAEALPEPAEAPKPRRRSAARPGRKPARQRAG